MFLSSGGRLAKFGLLVQRKLERSECFPTLAHDGSHDNSSPPTTVVLQTIDSLLAEPIDAFRTQTSVGET